MKVLLSAYACEPGRGSEPEVGLQALLAVASRHEVWVLTRSNNLPGLERFLATDPRRCRIHLIGLDLGPVARRLKARGQVALHLYYDAWQRRAGRLAVELDRRIGFDMVHHVTFAADWTRVGVSVLDRPLIWGPVGGAVRTPCSLLPVLGLRGAVHDIGRLLGHRLSRSVVNRGMAPRVSLALAQNRQTAARLSGPAIVLSNALTIDLDAPRTDSSARRLEIAVVGRLLPLKGGTLAVRTLPHVRHPGTRLVFYGAGPDLSRLRRTARAEGVADRVDFVGELPRQQVLERIASAGVLLHTSLHEEAGMVIAEALSLGTPVVCLDHGGPPEILRSWSDQPATAVRVGTPAATAKALADAVDMHLARPRAVARAVASPARGFAESLASAYDHIGTARPP